MPQGTFQGLPTYRWLPARATLETEFSIVAMRVDGRVRGVGALRPVRAGFALEVETGD